MKSKVKRLGTLLKPWNHKCKENYDSRKKMLFFIFPLRFSEVSKMWFKESSSPPPNLSHTLCWLKHWEIQKNSVHLLWVPPTHSQSHFVYWSLMKHWAVFHFNSHRLTDMLGATKEMEWGGGFISYLSDVHSTQHNDFKFGVLTKPVTLLSDMRLSVNSLWLKVCLFGDV